MGLLSGKTSPRCHIGDHHDDNPAKGIKRYNGMSLMMDPYPELRHHILYTNKALFPIALLSGKTMITPLPLEYYRKAYDCCLFDCTSSNNLEPLDEIIGQDRAVAALNFGLNIEEKGFNIYASGMQGTGRKSAVRKYIEALAHKKPRAHDWVYVNSFANPYEPNAILLPAGLGKVFKADMATFIDDAKRVIPRVFETEDYINRREAAVRSIEEEKAQIFAHTDQVAKEKGFLVQPGPQGLMTLPVKGEETLSQEEFLALPEQEQQEYQKRREELLVEIRNTFRQLRDLEQKGREAVDALNREVALNAIGRQMASLRDKYADVEEIIPYLGSVERDIIENLSQFMGEEVPPQTPAQAQAQIQAPLQFQHMLLRELAFRKYEVNVIVDNGDLRGAPVIFEQNPTYQNLFGKIEKEVQYGVFTTDFTMIRAGSIHKANGGYLVMAVEDLFRAPFSYDGLKTALKTGEVAIEDPGERMGFMTTKGIKPEPIPLTTKVVLIGTPLVNQILYTQDPEFQELFKVKAEFDTSMDRSEENISKYALFICSLCRECHIPHLDPTAMGRVIEYGSRLAADQNKLSTRFARIGDIVKEAGYYASLEKSEYTTGDHIQKAISERIYRSNLIQEKIQEFIAKGIVLIETEGAKVGQVNGLSVISLGDIEFGRPSRVTASVGVGKPEIMDIEREASMGGPIHTKGVLILAGYLNNTFAQDKPLSLSARLVFEQSYSGIDGDSASSTELYAILSALSGLPLKQSIAVTGSVNQNGEVQAIGGVNEKIEGFFEVCRASGLSGDQGAMIPASNVPNLMLRDEIVEAAKAGNFSIYPVRTIDEGIEVLTGVKAGERQEDGTFEKGTVNYLVDKRLREMAGALKAFTSPGK